MSACMSKKMLRIEEETMLMQKQGIVTILGSDHCDRNCAAAAVTSLRRTLSADMSSKKWLSQNELLSPMKKTASSKELSHSKATITADSLYSSEGEGEEDEHQERERFQIWSSIQRDKKEEHEEKAGQFDIWSSILSQKANDETSKLTSPPYVHPLVRRSKSCLSEKSLEICTESLGSETGSDGFSSYTPSETGDSEEDKEEEEVTTVLQARDEELELQLQVPKYNYSEKKSLPRCFPPPLSSLSCQHGPLLHMRPHRDNGRLFLQAVSVPSQNNFCAQRRDGRLVLTFASEDYDGYVAEEEEEEDHVEQLEEDIDDEAEEDESVIQQAMISSVDRFALMMNKPIGLVNNSPKWSEKFNQQVPNFKGVKVVQHGPLAQAFEYYWRTKLTAKAAPVPNNPFSNIKQNNYLSLNNNSKLVVSGNINQNSHDPQQLLVLRGNNGDYLVHNLKSCKDSRRPFLFWEPYCIAT